MESLTDVVFTICIIGTTLLAFKGWWHLVDDIWDYMGWPDDRGNEIQRGEGRDEN